MECLQYIMDADVCDLPRSFKPCYKWNAFNTEEVTRLNALEFEVLNLVISGMPSIPGLDLGVLPIGVWVLNLVISGMPSILACTVFIIRFASCFKPCYKWNAFNTEGRDRSYF